MPNLSDQAVMPAEAAPAASGSPPPPVPARNPTVWWMIAMLLAVIATALVVRRDDASFLASAWAQTTAGPRGSLEGGRGIYAFTGQIGTRNYGLFMLDVDTGTVWCYELQRVGGTGEARLSLVAARSWVFDRYLEEFNTDKPLPSEVRAMVQQQRSHRPAATQPGGGAGPD